MIVSCIPLRIRRSAQSFFTSALHNAALAMCLTLGFTLASAHAAEDKAKPVPLAQIDPARLAEIEAMLKTELQQVVNAQRRIEGQGKDVTVLGVWFDVRDTGTGVEEPRLIVDLSASYLPRDSNYLRGYRFIGADFEDLMHELHTTAMETLRDVLFIRGVDFLFEGKDIFYYYPEEFRPPHPEPAKKGKAVSTVGATVVTSAGHGFYRHYGSACGQPWCPQRDPANGITEDFITPSYATALSNWLIARSEATTHRTRSTATNTHVPSGQPWWKVAARYHLKQLYPDNPEIWHSLPNDQTDLREYNEDIRSRPLFANHIGANAIFHLHTNAGAANATGTRALYYVGDTADQQLANSILCYMKELIHARQPYQNWTVPDQAADGNHGENRLATMPSVIVEVGFHTNPGDAAALQDPVFRTAAMKGVEKGYRLHTEGEPCQPFKIDSIPDVSGPQNTPIPVNVHYEGFPEFPVKLKVDVVSCPSGWTCTGGELTIEDETPSPLQYTWTCNVSEPQPAATFGLRTRLTDVDQVKASPVEHNVTCTPATGPAPGGAVAGRPSAHFGPG